MLFRNKTTFSLAIFVTILRFHISQRTCTQSVINHFFHEKRSYNVIRREDLRCTARGLLKEVNDSARRFRNLLQINNELYLWCNIIYKKLLHFLTAYSSDHLSYSSEIHTNISHKIALFNVTVAEVYINRIIVNLRIPRMEIKRKFFSGNLCFCFCRMHRS